MFRRWFVAILVALLASNASASNEYSAELPEEDLEAGVSSTVSSTVTSTSPDSSTATSDSSASTVTGSTVTGSSDSTGSTVTGGSTQSTVSGATDNGASDSSTSPGSTTTVSTTEPPTTTLPHVNMSHVEFQMSCSDSVCTYNYIAPKLDPAFLATEQSLIDEQNTILGLVEGNITEYSSSATGEVNTVQASLTELRNQLNEAQDRLNALQGMVADTTSNLNLASQNLAAAQYYVDSLQNNRDSCYYQACVKPTPPPTPTQPPTTPPTTTASPCVGFPCHNNASDACLTDSQNKPYCTLCPGNLDGHLSCDTSVCSSDIVMVGAGAFWSPGFYGDGQNQNGTAYPENSVCVWNITIPQAGSVTGFKVNNMDTSTVLTIEADNGKKSVKIANGTSVSIVNYIFRNPGPYLVTLTTKNVPQNAYFEWNVMP